jgi:hypothetical protein
MLLEAALLRLGLRLPAGLSLLALLRKPATVAVKEERERLEGVPGLPIDPPLPTIPAAS